MRMERKYVRRRRITAVILFLAVFAGLNYITIPKECRVSVEEMSQFCEEIRFP
jgi:hypothetical protein